MEQLDELISKCEASIAALERFHTAMIQCIDAFDEEDSAQVSHLCDKERNELERLKKERKRLQGNNSDLGIIISSREACFNTYGNEVFAEHPELLRFFVEKQQSLKALLQE